MCPRLTPKTPLFAFIKESGLNWSQGVPASIDTMALRDPSRALFEVFGPIVDQVVDAKRAQFLVLGDGRCPNDLGAEVLSDLGRGDTNPAARGMDQHRF